VAGEQGPFVLVGHSFGGLFVRLYAATWPEDVAGLVLVDALSEAVRDNLSPADWAAYAVTISAVPPELASYADLETVHVNASFDEMTEALADQPLTGTPVYVIAAGLPFGLPEADLGFSPDALQAAWAASQAYLETLTPDARYVVATESSHYVQIQQPDLVISAIEDVTAAVRDPETWATATVDQDWL
jgi:pimeloyl-ACP methyl ester carboxylesterase